MPKTRYRTRYVKAKRSYRRANVGTRGLLGNVLWGAVAGGASRFAAGLHPLAGPAVTAGVGWFAKNPTLQTIGGLQLGNMAAGMIGGGTSNAGAGWY